MEASLPLKEDTHMRAIVYHTYGSPDVLKLEEVQKPVLQDDEVLVKVLAASAAEDCQELLGHRNSYMTIDR